MGSSNFMRLQMPGEGDSNFPCVFSAAMAKVYESRKKPREHVGSGWRAERTTGEGHGAVPGVSLQRAITRMEGGYLDVWGAGISDNVQVLPL